MSINAAFYQIAKNVAASDIAQIIGAKITGIETTETEKGIIKDIASFHSASASTLVYQADPELLVGFKIREAIIITNEAGAAAAGHLEELFQIELWGEDVEATARRERIWRELASAEMFLGLLLAES